jgi:glycosyltransferase involved in cell wall biosynthesis
MTPPRVTIGIPFFDEEPFLEAAVRSILAQTFGDFELILVDDGSRDGSLALARSFSDPRIAVLSDGVRRGLPARLNQIVGIARGEIVARMDADDVSHPARLARQLAVLDGDPSCSAVGTWAGLIDEREETFAVVEAAPALATPQTALDRGLIPHASMVARRAWLSANPYDETLTRAEDRDLWCRTVGTTRFEAVPEPLYVVRTRTTDASFLSDYVASQRQNRTLFLRHGPRTYGTLRTGRRVVESLGKGLAMRASVMAGFASRLVKRRGRAPTAGERALIEEALRASRA